MNKPRHAPMDQFPVVDDCLVIGGVALPELARRVGRTPFYAYDRRLITERVALLRKLLPRSVHIHYAIKANPMPEVVKHLAGLVDGLDVASAGELKIALGAGMRPEAISFAGPRDNPKAFVLDKEMFKLAPKHIALIVITLMILAALYVRFWKA